MPDQVLKAGNDLVAVVQGGVSDGGSVDCEEGAVIKCFCGSQTEERSLNGARSKMEEGTY